MKATIVNTVANTTNVIELPEDVRTVADLRNTLDIEEGAQLYEGSSRTDLTSDNTPLPQLTGNKAERGYVFFVSPAQNKIKNGALSRAEVYAAIKEASLQEAVKQRFGRNFTLVSTQALADFLEENNPEPVVVEDEPGITTEKELFKTLLKLINAVEFEEQEALTLALEEGIEKVFPNPYSVQDIENMK